jgi:phosphohistidine phosphatase
VIKLVLIRHAIAEEREAFAQTGKPDRQRPLTKKGRSRMTDAAKGLKLLVPQIGLIGTSPLLRARQTARIVAKRYRGVVVEPTQALAPDTDPLDLLDWLAEHSTKGNLALVGHEPDLGQLASWLLCGARRSSVRFGKAGACCIEFEDGPEPGAGIVSWCLSASALRRLGA